MLSRKNSKVIINADDFGITKGVNKAIYKLIEAGIVTSTSVMSNMPYLEEINSFKNRAGIGIHFNLTTGKPINNSKNVPSLVNEKGDFFDLSGLVQRMNRRQITEEDVHLELNSQIQRLIDMGIKPDHINSHSSILKYPYLMKIAGKVAGRYEIKAARTFSPRKFDYARLFKPRSGLISLYLLYQKFIWKKHGFNTVDKYDSLLKMGLDYNAAIEKLKNVFSNLPDGILEFVVHPGYCNEDNSPLGTYIHERDAELHALLSDAFKKVMEYSHVELISFKDI